MAKRNVISQREARHLRRRVDELENDENIRRNSWARKYPGGTHIGSLEYANSRELIPAIVENSRRLGHAVIAISDGASVHLYALPLGRKP